MVPCSFAIETIGIFLLAVLPVSVKTSAGKITEGDLDGFTQSSLLLNQTGQVTEYAFDDLLSLRPTDSEEKTGPTYRVTLVGGSRIAAVDLSLTENEVLIELRRQNQLRVPLDQVKAVRYRPSSVSTDAQWLGILDRQQRGDSLVIRRPGNRLDPQQGVVESVMAATVGFNIDGTRINAPVDRLEGIIFGGTQSLVEGTDIRVTDVYGSTWSVISIEPSLGDQPLQMRLSSSVMHELPLHQIESIRWSGGFSLLAYEKPANRSFQPYFQTNVSGNLLKDLFAPNRDGEADLLMFGGSSIEYRIEPGYQLLAGTVRRGDKITNAGKVSVQIELDGETVWQEELPDGEPRGFELSVEQSRRLKFVVDSHADGDLGDTVRISRPRLLK